MSAIQYYEGGKAISGDAPQTKASGITFDNTNSDLVSEDVESAIKEVNNRTKHGTIKLWKNTNPSSNFAGQSIDVNVSGYAGVVIAFAKVASDAYGAMWMEYDNSSFNNSNSVETYTLDYSTSKVSKHVRSVTINTSTNKITFGDALTDTQTSLGSQVSRTSPTNDKLIPMTVYGIIEND